MHSPLCIFFIIRYSRADFLNLSGSWITYLYPIFVWYTVVVTQAGCKVDIASLQVRIWLKHVEAGAKASGTTVVHVGSFTRNHPYSTSFLEAFIFRAQRAFVERRYQWLRTLGQRLVDIVCDCFLFHDIPWFAAGRAFGLKGCGASFLLLSISVTETGP